MIRLGTGYDVHRLVEGRRLVLGGVEIPFERGLEGHSDADVLIHAISDALLGALGECDIGHYFPNTEPRWKDAPSRVFLEEIRLQIEKRHGRIVNIDSTLIAQRPKIAPHLPAMKETIGRALHLEPGRIGIKATTNESLGFIGREEGLAAMAVAGVDLPD